MRVEEIVKDLFNLEINLIESRDITGRKMESASVGMAQIANKYAVYLNDRMFRSFLEKPLDSGPTARVIREPEPSPSGAAPSGGAGADAAASAPGDVQRSVRTYAELAQLITDQSDTEYTRQTFEDLNMLAEQVIANGDFERHAERLGVVVRIRGVSQQLRILAKKWDGQPFIRSDPETGEDEPDPESLTTADRLRIRKAWEVGINVLIMQTVIQLDGDIVTRISSDRLAGVGGDDPSEPDDHPSSDEDVVFQLHRQLVDTGLDNWRTLFRTVAELAGKAFRALLS